jgi:hypothetical protein
MAPGFYTGGGGGGATPADVWGYPTRTLTQTKFPFWSGIITLTGGSVSIPAGAIAYVEIRPPVGETWYVTIASRHNIIYAYDLRMTFEIWDGVSALEILGFSRYYITSHGTHLEHGSIVVTVIITSSRWCRIKYNNPHANAITTHYGYSGFKLSHPQWSPVRAHNPKPEPWKKPLRKPLPPEIAPLRKYAYDMLGADPARPEEYEPSIVLEESTPLAVDPVTGQPVELLTVIVRASVLAELIAKFKTGELDPVGTGYKKYLDKWGREGIKLL